MFTGIIEAVGSIRSRESRGGDQRLWIERGELELGDVVTGDSIAVAGVCVTVVALDPGGFSADLSRETLRLTTLGAAPVGARVNLERALRLDTRLGGHLLSGHVDGVARIVDRQAEGRGRRLQFELEPALARFVATKGAIAVDGVSLTVNRVAGPRFEVNLIPHTLACTTLAELEVGSEVNVEVDLMARYAARWLETGVSVDRQQ